MDTAAIRADFPILNRTVNGQPLVYFDNAATSQTPQQVIDVITDYYTRYNANIHRGVHSLSQEATDAYELTPVKKYKPILMQQRAHEIILTAGTTHAINIVASGYAAILQAGDELLVSAMEHHSNIVPWQMLCEKTAATLKVIPMHPDGTNMAAYNAMLSTKTKLVFVNHVSNALEEPLIPLNTFLKKPTLWAKSTH